jgi:hypothetical protein
MRSWSFRTASGILIVSALAACREGTDVRAGDFSPVVPSLSGTQGCGPSTPIPGSVTPVFTDGVIGPLSQIAATAGAETLYLTGEDASIHQLDFPLGGGPPVDTVLVAPGIVEAEVLTPVGIAGPARLSGIAIFDDQFLVVAEHASNTLISVHRDVPDSVDLLAGLPNASGGFSDGAGGGIRFHFTEPVPLLASAFGTVYVGDTENHALRLVAVGGIPTSSTLAGTGAPGASEGALSATQFDTPSGIATDCPGQVLVLTSGEAGQGGRRLLSLAIGGLSPFGGFDGSSMTLAGDGTDATTQGIDKAAQLGTPKGLVATQDGLFFWIDAKDGILRRHDVATGLSDCPLFADCAAAVTAGGSFSGTHFSLALGDSGSIYVLEADTETLYRIDP